MKRGLHGSTVFQLGAFDVKSIVLNTKIKPLRLDEISNDISKKPTLSKARKTDATHIPSWFELNEFYNPNYVGPTAAELNSVNHFFNSADIRYEWSAANFMDIPGEKLKEQFGSHLDARSNKTGKKFPGKTGIPFELVNGLPEVAFLGKSNAGKSTLLNNLTTDLKKNSLNRFAKASKKAGFTKTLNSFNIGNRFRLIDTPGYGFNSSIEQGNVTMRYLKERKELARCFLLISGEQGFSELDLSIVNYMKEGAIPFEIVFTKIDKVKDTASFKEMLDAVGIKELPTLPQLIFTNSVASKSCTKRYGIDILRFVILQSCGLHARLRPSRKKTVI